MLYVGVLVFFVRLGRMLEQKKKKECGSGGVLSLIMSKSDIFGP